MKRTFSEMDFLLDEELVNCCEVSQWSFTAVHRDRRRSVT